MRTAAPHRAPTWQTSLSALLLSAAVAGASSEPAPSTPAISADTTMATTIYDFSANRLDGKEQSLAEYRGHVLLVVNTASRCGLTPQYQGLQQLYDDYRERGLVVLGFPCNQFAGQEPGTADDIASFCRVNYGVTFPMFARIDVNGDTAHPLYQWLKSERPGLFASEAIKWNFTKFLVDRQGQPVHRYAPQTPPADLRGDIEALLAAVP
jgi:glutathione peroxidase